MLSTIFSIAAAIVLLGVLILIHEFGHFIVAKKLGVGVEKFSLGFGKKIIGKQFGETEYLLCAVPLGGYVKLVGDDPDEEVTDPEKSFLDKSVWVRLSVVLAGPVFNLLLAVFIYTGVFMHGIEVYSDKAIIGSIKDKYPAQEAGLLKGDTIIEINNTPVNTWIGMAEIISKFPGKQLAIRVQRGKQQFEVNITPHVEKMKDSTGKEVEVGLIGIERMIVVESYGPINAFKNAILKTIETINLMYMVIHKMIVGEISSKQLGGPLLIAQMAGKVANAGLLPYMTFTALISINLGIMNLLPIPILDGGHIFFFLIEAIFRKPLNLKVKEKAQQVGLFLLITLMVFAFYNDIVRFIG